MTHMEAPPDNDYCSVCHDSFTLPCQANCAHWFCAECILRVWQHSSVLEPCKCPICRRAITLLIPFEGNVMGDHQPDLDVDRILQNLAKYNRIFGGGPVSLLQRARDMPLLLRRMLWELMDPQRAIPLVHRTRILFFLVLLAVYVFSPFDVIPEVGTVELSEHSSRRDFSYRDHANPIHNISLSHPGLQKTFEEQLHKDLENIYSHRIYFGKDKDSLPKGEKFLNQIFLLLGDAKWLLLMLECYFTHKWPMQELPIQAQSQFSDLKVLPLFYKLLIVHAICKMVPPVTIFDVSHVEGKECICNFFQELLLKEKALTEKFVATCHFRWRGMGSVTSIIHWH